MLVCSSSHTSVSLVRGRLDSEELTRCKTNSCPFAQQIPPLLRDTRSRPFSLYTSMCPAFCMCICIFIFLYSFFFCLCLHCVFRVAQKEVESSPSGPSGEILQRVQICSAANTLMTRKIASTLLFLFVSISAVQQCTIYFCLLAYVCDGKGLFVKHSVSARSAVIFCVLQFKNTVFINYY